MAYEMDDLEVSAEEKRLYKLLDRANVTEQQKEALAPVVGAMAWQRIKLQDTQRLMQNMQVAIPYDNGGGQSGIRQNPVFKGYTELWRAYMLGFETFSKYLPKEIQEEETAENISILDKVKQMKKGAK